MTVEAAIHRRGKVRSTSGQAESRLFVAALVRIGPVLKRIELGLVDRKNMIYRMLLGRRALSGSFLVDAARRYLLTRERLPEPRAEEAADPR